MKFIADHMLGTLAKWLRLLGYDTLYPKNLKDVDLVEMARKEGRVLLTRDKEIPKRKISRDVKIILISQEDLQMQLTEVFTSIGLKPDPEKILMRCSVCNAAIKPISKIEAQDHIPEGVLECHEKFWECPDCSRYYWEGTHWKKIMETIEKINLSISSDAKSYA
jgi:uncharacterized protein with PIN domain